MSYGRLCWESIKDCWKRKLSEGIHGQVEFMFVENMEKAWV